MHGAMDLRISFVRPHVAFQAVVVEKIPKSRGLILIDY